MIEIVGMHHKLYRMGEISFDKMVMTRSQANRLSSTSHFIVREEEAF